MKKFIFRLSILLLIIGGLALFTYPFISDRLNTLNGSRVIGEYENSISSMDPDEKEAELEAAREYNTTLTGNGIRNTSLTDSDAALLENYTNILNFDDGVIGAIEIPAIDVYLPIYHDSSDEILEKGIGHLKGSAFPIGGEGDHTVLTGHSGTTNAKLFTDLDKLVVGDVFYIHVLDEILAYEADQILIVEPENTDDLHPILGEDHVTLVTCTPLGVNSHRLLVRGIRIPYDPDTVQTDETAQGAGFRIMILIIALFLVVVTISVVFRHNKNMRCMDARLKKAEAPPEPGSLSGDGNSDTKP